VRRRRPLRTSLTGTPHCSGQCGAALRLTRHATRDANCPEC